MTIGERFKAVRKLADEPKKKCSQSDFGEMFKIGRDAVANIENGRVEPSEVLIENICNRFDISYDWLKYGLEPMRVAKSKEDEIADLVGSTLSGSSDFKKSVIRMICSRTDGELKALEAALRAIYEDIEKEKNQGN